MKEAIDTGDMNTVRKLKEPATQELNTLMNIESTLAFPQNLVSRSRSIHRQLMSIDERVSKDTLVEIQESIVAYIGDVANWAGSE